jgi:2-oxoglutarate ferredoxin oxidoreductase subunit alpha
LWPYPYEELHKLSEKVGFVLTVEMSAGQMVEDVKLAVNGKTEVFFYGRTAGVVPTPNEVLEELKKKIGTVKV